MQHLKEKQYYIDFYDKLTVDRCRDIVRFHDEIDDSVFAEAEEKPTEEEIARVKYTTREMYLYFITGEEYQKKDNTINKWMNRDRQLDERVENAEEPQLIRCKTCASKMTCTSRDLWSSDDRVQFFFECPNKCLPHRIIYEDGTEYQSKPTLCPKCSHEMTRDSEKLKDHIVTTVYTCLHCDHSFTDEFDLTPTEEPDDPDFEKDRERFCLSEKKGRKFIEDLETMKQLSKFVEKQKEREKKKDVYDKVATLTKMTVPQMKAHLLELFDKEGYSNLVFEKPDMRRIVSIEFTVEEMNTENERVSERKLKKLIQNHLKETNWRLMSDGISYRLGILSGRVRIYEDEDDLAKLIEKNK